MRNYCLIFVTLFFASLLFKESTSCDGGMGCMCVRPPCPCQNRKITLTVDVEDPTPECKEGSPCVRGSDCGENGYCFSPSSFGTRYYYYLLCSTHYKSNMVFFCYFSECRCELWQQPRGGKVLPLTKSNEAQPPNF